MCGPFDANFNPITGQAKLASISSIFGSYLGISTSFINQTKSIIEEDPNYNKIMNLLNKTNSTFANASVVYF